MPKGGFTVLVLLRGILGFLGPAFARVPLEVLRRKAARLTIAAVRCRDKMKNAGWGDKS